MGQRDYRFNHFHDHLVLRLFTCKNRRTHFPIVISTTDSRYYVVDMQRMFHLAITDFPVLHLTRCFEEALENFLNEANISERKGNLLVRFCTTDPFQLTSFFELFKTKALKGRVLDCRELFKQTNFHETVRAEFECRLSRALSSPHLQSLLDRDQATLPILLAQLFLKMNVRKRMYKIYTGTFYHQRWIEDPLIKSLMHEGILAHNFYNSYIVYSNLAFAELGQQWALALLQEMSLLRRARFWLGYWWTGYDFENIFWFQLQPFYKNKDPRSCYDFEFPSPEKWHDSLGDYRDFYYAQYRLSNGKFYYFNTKTGEKEKISS